jgi:hypothetical protein
MRTIRNVLLIAAGCFLSACGDEAGPTAPAPAAAPLIAGTWMGTVTSGGATTCPITVEIEQPNAGREVTGRIDSSCGLPKAEFHSGALYGRLVEGLPWSIVGSVQYTNVWSQPYGEFFTNLRGSLEGSPVSRISATSDGFRKKGLRTGGADPMRFEVTRSAE